MSDDLNRPLGQNTPAERRRGVPPLLLQAVAGALALVLAVFAYSALFVDNPLGGEPMVIMPLEPEKAPAAPRAAGAAPQLDAVNTEAGQHAGPPKDAAVKTVTIIDGTSGRRQEVTIKDPPKDPPKDAAAKPSPVPDARVLEQTRHGPIPKVAHDGTRPADLYARASKAAAKADTPRIAVVVGGLGTGATRTVEGLRKLAPDVTLAFSPYAKDLDQWVARATSQGHEMLLQVAMEPFDYPDNDPGPQTLLTSLAAEQNVDRLHWFMSRFGGYVGIANYMGQRFTASDQALGPVLREVARRGLIYFDDATVPRSLAAQIAGANNVAFAKADVVIDAAPTAADIDAALARLEQIARERGQAVGAASALPVAIDRIARWAKQLESRGIVLAPLSAVANRPKSS